MIKMNPEIKEKWLQALRSGKYKQGKKCLFQIETDEDGECEAKFCCLGVLCDLWMEEHPGKAEWIDEYDEVQILKIDEINYSIYLPPAVQQWAELKSNYGSYGSNKSLSHLNDDGVSFEEIANIIEEKF